MFTLAEQRVQFSDSQKRAKNLCALFGVLEARVPAALDCHDILRSAVVLSFSGFDFLLHRIQRAAIVECFVQSRDVRRFEIPIRILSMGYAGQLLEIDALVSEKFSHKSFFSFDGLRDVLSQFVDHPVEQLSSRVGMERCSLEARWKQLVRWRNRITHEADLNPVYGGISTFPIRKEDVIDAVNFVESVGVSCIDCIEVELRR